MKSAPSGLSGPKSLTLRTLFSYEYSSTERSLCEDGCESQPGVVSGVPAESVSEDCQLTQGTVIAN